MNDWTVVEETRANGREISPGTEVSIRGERGRFAFRRLVRTSAGLEWIDVFGGPAGHETIRSFRPARIRTVHRDRKLRQKGES